MRTVWKMLAINPVLFASLITAHKAAVENPEQRVDIHKPPNTPVPDRVKLISPAGRLGNQHLVKQKDSRVSNFGQRHHMNDLWLHPQKQQLKDFAAAPHVTVHSVQTLHQQNAPVQILDVREGFVLTLGSTLTIMFTVSIKFRDAAGSLM